MAFHWCVDDGPTLNAGLVALCFFQEIRTSIAQKPYIFMIFKTPCHPSGLAHGVMVIFTCATTFPSSNFIEQDVFISQWRDLLLSSFAVKKSSFAGKRFDSVKHNV